MISYREENYVKDKVIIVSGASSGYGAATAKKAAALGAKVVLCARREELLKQNVEEIRANGGEAVYKVTDIRHRDQVEAAAKFALDTYGRIDVLVNDAGTMPNAYFAQHEWAMEPWEECIDTCIKGILYFTCAVYDQMMAQGQGQVINVSSIMGNLPVSGSGVYCACKAAVRYMNESLRTEARGHIKTTVIRPTFCSKTGLGSTVVSGNAATSGSYHKSMEGLMKMMAAASDPVMGAALNDRNSISLIEPTPEDMADGIIYTINQPWGVDISDLTVRASNEPMFN